MIVFIGLLGPPIFRLAVGAGLEYVIVKMIIFNACSAQVNCFPCKVSQGTIEPSLREIACLPVGRLCRFESVTFDGGAQ